VMMRFHSIRLAISWEGAIKDRIGHFLEWRTTFHVKVHFLGRYISCEACIS
jgi:hypothetical protein